MTSLLLLLSTKNFRLITDIPIFTEKGYSLFLQNFGAKLVLKVWRGGCSGLIAQGQLVPSSIVKAERARAQRLGAK